MSAWFHLETLCPAFPSLVVACVIYHQMRQKQAVIYWWYHRQYVLLAGPQVRFHSACWYFSVDERLSLWANGMWNINSGPDKVPQIIQAFWVLFISSFLSAPRNWCSIPLKGYPALSHCPECWLVRKQISIFGFRLTNLATGPMTITEQVD